MDGLGCILPNQVVKLRNSQDIWVFVLGKAEFFSKVWMWVLNKYITVALISRDTRTIYVSILNVSWRHIHYHRVGR